MIAALARVGSLIRRMRDARPRLVWGPVPIISLKHWSRAMRERGYSSMTCVTHVYPSFSREDFDVYRDNFDGGRRWPESLRDYAFFAWTLRRGDVFIRFLDGGFLRHTRLEWWETRLLRLAGKKLIVIPYGGDIAVAGHLGELEEPLFTDYPSLREASDETERWARHSLEWADVAVHHHQPGFMPRYDAMLANHFAIDLASSDGEPEYSDADGHNGLVTVMHAPNHRHIKGTKYLEEAVEELRRDGLQIELRIIERRPNEEVRAAMESSDILADQFLSPGYAMFSIEAMAAGRPTLNNIGALPDALRATEVIRACPLVNTNPERLADDLRRLAEDPGLRRELGTRGRAFVERYHSYEALGREWEAIVSYAWSGTPLPDRLVPATAP